MVAQLVMLIFLNLKTNSTLALPILITSTFSHPTLSLINVLQQNFLFTRFSLPTQTELIFISGIRYLIPNNWKPISIWMRLLQNLLVTDSVWVFWKVWQSSWCHLRKWLCHQQSSLFWFIGLLSVYTPLIPCHYHWNGWRPWLQQHTERWRVGSPVKLPT